MTMLKPLTVAFAVCAFAMAAPAAAQTAPDAAASPTVSALQQRIDSLKAALAGDVCADPAEARRLVAVAPLVAGGASQSIPDRPPVPAPPSGAAETPLPRKDIVDRLHTAVVLVLSGEDTGSGFFVTPDTVITNNHVVENAGSDGVVVVGRGIQGPMEAVVIARTGSQEGNDRDYAILRVPGARIQGVLPITAVATELAAVVAAGYPGLLLENDRNFLALIRGDMNAMPDLALSQGAVMAIQNRAQGLPILAHSAPISGGNSGGPLVDGCGRVIGINTFINVAVDQASSAGFALGSADLIAYLKENGVAPDLRTSGCGE